MFASQPGFVSVGGMPVPIPNGGPGFGGIDIPSLLRLLQGGGGPAAGMAPQPPAAHTAPFAPRTAPGPAYDIGASFRAPAPQFDIGAAFKPQAPSGAALSGASPSQGLSLADQTGGAQSGGFRSALPSPTQGMSLMDLINGVSGGGGPTSGPVEGTYLPPGTASPGMVLPGSSGAPDEYIKQLMEQIGGLRSSRDAARQAYLTAASEGMPQMGRMVGPHMNAPLGILAGLLAFAANRERPHLQMGTQGLQSLLQGLQGNAQTANQNTQISYQNQAAQHDQIVKQAAAKLGWSDEDLQGVLGQINAAQNRAMEQYKADQGVYGKLGVQDKRNQGNLDLQDKKNEGRLDYGRLIQEGRLKTTQWNQLMKVNPGADRFNYAVNELGIDPDTARAVANANPQDMKNFATANNLNDLVTDRQATRPGRLANLETTNEKLGAQIDGIYSRAAVDDATVRKINQFVNLYPDEYKARIAKLQADTYRSQMEGQKASQFGINMGSNPAILQKESTTLRGEASINAAAIKSYSAKSDANDADSDTSQTIRMLESRQQQIRSRLADISNLLRDPSYQPGKSWGESLEGAITAPMGIKGKIGNGMVPPVVPGGVVSAGPPPNPKIGMTWQHPSGATYVFGQGPKGVGWYRKGK